MYKLLRVSPIYFEAEFHSDSNIPKFVLCGSHDLASNSEFVILTFHLQKLTLEIIQHHSFCTSAFALSKMSLCLGLFVL
jgi:hypothetical protein